MLGANKIINWRFDMKKRQILIFLFLLGIFLTSCSESKLEGLFLFYNKLLSNPKYIYHSDSNLNKQFRGVWVGKDIEIVRTDNFELIFERDKNDSTLIRSTFSIIALSDSCLNKHS